MDLDLRAPDPEAVEEVRRLLAEEGVVTRPPGPAATDWFAELGRALSDALLAWRPETEVVGTALAAVLLLGAAIVVVLLALALLRRRAAAPAPRAEQYLDAQLPGTAALASPAAWRIRLDACLAAGDHAGALEAMWSWLLAAVAGRDTDVRPLTARKLIRSAGRPELLPLVRRLEAASYAAERKTSANLYELAEAVEAELGR